MMDQNRLSESSHFYDEISFPAQRQVGFWKSDSMPDPRMDVISRTSGSMSVVSSPLDKLLPAGAQSVGSVKLSHHSLVGDQKTKLSLEQRVMGSEGTNLSMSSWGSMDPSLGSRSNIFVQPASYFVEVNKDGVKGTQYENGHFSSSLSEIFNKKVRLSSNDVLFGQSADVDASHHVEEEPSESIEEVDAKAISDLLPDDDDLFSGVFDEPAYIAQRNNGADIEDFDLFSSGGGMELEGDDGGQRFSEFSGGCAGEHPYGEHPSRTLFVRNINSNVEDAELKVLFEQYGDIRTLYTACKHRGFVMISYYDIRAARNAMRALQNKPLKRRKLDIHFSIPKDNPSEKDINQGTLVVFNLDSSVSNDVIFQIFGVYGEIKEIRETPNKLHHKFIEFYDVRAAEAALRALNRTDIAGKRIKLEPSRPGGARRCMMQRFPPELEQRESGVYQQRGSPHPNNSPSGCFEPVSRGEITSGFMEDGTVHGLRSAIGAPISPFMEHGFDHGISSSSPLSLPSPMGIASIGNQSGLGEPSHSLGQMQFGFQCMPTFHPQSLPEFRDDLANEVLYNSSGTMAGILSLGPSEGIDNWHIRRVGTNGHLIELNGSFCSSGNGSCPLHGHHCVWSNSNSHYPHPLSHMMLPNSPSFVNDVHAHPLPQLHELPIAPSNMMNIHHRHVGSAPAINHSLLDRRHAHAGKSSEASGFHPASFGSMGLSADSTLHPVGLASHNIFPHGGGGNCMDPLISTTNIGLHSPQQRCHKFYSRNSMIPVPKSFDAPNERVKSHKKEAGVSLIDIKKQYELNIDRILCGEDNRTTLMIKNIPNKYTSKMLLDTIDERHRGMYDFIYLPIDFKNKCNVGYAFINMINLHNIIPFYQAFNGKKWDKFNSEKVTSLAYARIQGKAALIAHFQNSSLMNEDKRCRPILFHSDGPNAGDQEPFPMATNIKSRAVGKANGEESSNGTDSS